jgi:hypothetical protein
MGAEAVPNRSARMSVVRALILVLLVVIGAVGGWIWWASGCHDDYCSGSTHHATIHVRAASGVPSCWNDIDDVELGGRYWESRAHAPASWGNGPVTGTFRVTGDGEHHPLDSRTGFRTAVFTADRGGSVTFFGGTAGFFDDLMCAVN